MPGTTTAHNTLFANALNHESGRRYKTALALYKKCIERLEKEKNLSNTALRAQCTLAIGRCLKKQGQGSEAQNWFLDALGQDAVDEYSLNALQKFFASRAGGKNAELDDSAPAHLDKLMQLQPKLAWPKACQAVLVLRNEETEVAQREAAFEILQNESMREAFQPEATLALAEALLQKSDYAKACEYLKPHIENGQYDNHDSFERILMYYAAALTGLEQFQQCLDHLEPHILAPEASTALQRLAAYCAFQLGKTERAFALLHDLQKKNSQGSTGQNLLLQLFLERGMYDEAFDLVRQHFHGENTMPDISILHAQLAQKLGKTDTALQDWQRWLQKNGKAVLCAAATTESVLTMLFVALHLGRFEIALDLFNRAFARHVKKLAEDLACRLLEYIILRAGSEDSKLDEKALSQICSKFLKNFASGNDEKRLMLALLQTGYVNAVSENLAQWRRENFDDANFLHQNGLANYARAIECEHAGEYDQAIKAWRLVFACWAPLFRDGRFLLSWAVSTREQDYGIKLNGSDFHNAQRMIEQKMQNRLSEVADTLQQAGDAQRRRIYSYLFYEFLREREFARWMHAEKIRLPGDSKAFVFGPRLIRELDLTKPFFREIKKIAKEQEQTDIFENLLARLLQKPDASSPVKGKTFHTWREMFSTIGVARILIDSKEYHKALAFLNRLHCDNDSACKSEGCRHDARCNSFEIQYPCGECDLFFSANPGYRPDEFKWDAVTLAIQAHLEMAFAEIVKIDRDFAIVGRHWKALLDLASSINKEKLYHGKIVDTCLGIAKSYERQNKFSVAIQFLENCNTYLDDLQLVDKIAWLKNILAVAYNRKKDYATALQYMREVLALRVENEAYLANYFNIAAKFVKSTIEKETVQAREVAQEVIATLRKPRYCNQKINNLTVKQVSEYLALKFRTLAQEIADDNPEKAWQLLEEGVKLGLLKGKYARSVGRLIRKEMKSKRQKNGEKFVQELKTKYKDNPAILAAISEAEKNSVLESAIELLDSDDVLAGIDTILETADFQKFDSILQLSLIYALRRAYKTNNIRDALKRFAQKCKALENPRDFAESCVAGYLKYIKKEGEKGNKSVARELFDDAHAFFPGEKLSLEKSHRSTDDAD